MQAYRLVLSSPFSAIELYEDIESDRHSTETSSDILGSYTCEMIIRHLQKDEPTRVHTCDDNLKVASGRFSIPKSFGFRFLLLKRTCLSTKYDHKHRFKIELLTLFLEIQLGETFETGDKKPRTFFLANTRRLRGIRTVQRSRR